MAKDSLTWSGKKCECGHYIPDEYDRCDSCIMTEYDVLSMIDGFGILVVKQEKVIAAIRKAESKGG